MLGMGREDRDGCTGSRKHRVSVCRLPSKHKKKCAGRVAWVAVGRSKSQVQLVQSSKEMMQGTPEYKHTAALQKQRRIKVV